MHSLGATYTASSAQSAQATSATDPSLENRYGHDMDNESVSFVTANAFSELLKRPLGRRMLSDIKVKMRLVFVCPVDRFLIAAKPQQSLIDRTGEFITAKRSSACLGGLQFLFYLRAVDGKDSEVKFDLVKREVIDPGFIRNHSRNGAQGVPSCRLAYGVPPSDLIT